MSNFLFNLKQTKNKNQNQNQNQNEDIYSKTIPGSQCINGNPINKYAGYGEYTRITNLHEV